MSESSDLDVFTLKLLSAPPEGGSGCFALVRDDDGTESVLGTYGSFEDASEAMDQAIGRGGGVESYRIVETPKAQPAWKAALKRVGVAVIVLLAVGVVAFIVWALLGPNESGGVSIRFF
jgi:hypothetical protein